MGRNKRVILGRFPNVVSVVNPTLAHKVAEGPTLVEILRGTRVVDVAKTENLYRTVSQGTSERVEEPMAVL